MNQETILQNKIIVALCERGCFAVNHTVGDFYTKYGGRVSVGNPGESDIWGHRPHDGKAFYVEVKMPGEKPRKDQLDFIEAMKNSGAIAGWCTSIPEALNIVFEGGN
ncbi:MAG: VRR-NUC domain-containing protein [Clostridia bacterium]|nr:VRR-NUC domain-containing protein [Clostridia bacterium]